MQLLYALVVCHQSEPRNMYIYYFCSLIYCNTTCLLSCILQVVQSCALAKKLKSNQKRSKEGKFFVNLLMTYMGQWPSHSFSYCISVMTEHDANAAFVLDYPGSEAGADDLV